MGTIVVASPVRQDDRILRPFLDALAQLDGAGHDVVFRFVDDNDDAASSALLREFVSTREGEVLDAPPRGSAYERDQDARHLWHAELTERVGAHKDRLLDRALEEGADAVLLVDSDLVLHPATLRALAAADRDIVAEVFWTRWTSDDPELPNIWACDDYTLFERGQGEHGDDGDDEADAAARAQAYLERLRLPALHPVGGLGACTLVRRRAIAAGVRFRPIPNLTWQGEDRHFCLRAMALGFSLWADSHFPPLHLYRESDLARLDEHRAGAAALLARWDLLQWIRAEVDDARARGDARVRVRGRANVVRSVEMLGDERMLAFVEVDVEVAGDPGDPPRLDREIVRVDLRRRPG